ncbi:MAG: Coenzyme F420 hydrogenase/dehydrogenase, beta subunit C-terminal domain [Syntrophobacterales bacterium]|nr:Coenzyme F420 hydrogenase/dehydrogenase, beta subunit C-terminal domain [Syntrophobacterales bacterium]
MNKEYGPDKLIRNVIEGGLCIGCGACVDLCPYFRSYRGKTVSLFPCTREAGRCFAHCPKVEVNPDDLSRFLFAASYDGEPLGRYRSIHIARAGAKVKKQPFQAGGTVSALACYALRAKLIRGAILTGRAGLLPLPRLATGPAGVFGSSLSKYAAAPTVSALNRAVAAGYTELGIVATPCQATAVTQMRMNPLQEPSFQDPVALVIGLFCTWALDFRRFEAFLKDRVSLREIVKVDIPPPPAAVLEVYLKQGKKEFPLEEVRPLVPDGCGYCIDMTAEFADVSVGVLEGRPDRNTLIIRTARGEDMVRKAEQAGYLVLEDMPAENLAHLGWAAANKKRRGVHRCLETERINGEEGTACLRLNEEILQQILKNAPDAPTSPRTVGG